MKKLVLAFEDGDAQVALRAAVQAVEAVNKASVYRAWAEEVHFQPGGQVPALGVANLPAGTDVTP